MSTPTEGEQGEPLTATPSAACTAACTSEAENANAGTLETHQDGKGEGAGGSPSDPLAALAAAIAGLSPGNRERLAGMLLEVDPVSNRSACLPARSTDTPDG
jgi:hypothetical protein